MLFESLVKIKFEIKSRLHCIELHDDDCSLKEDFFWICNNLIKYSMIHLSSVGYGSNRRYIVKIMLFYKFSFARLLQTQNMVGGGFYPHPLEILSKCDNNIYLIKTVRVCFWNLKNISIFNTIALCKIFKLCI